MKLIIIKINTFIISSCGIVEGGGSGTVLPPSSFLLFWIKNNRLDAHDNQYAICSLDF